MLGAQYQRIEQIALSVMAQAENMEKRVSHVVATVGCVILLMNRKMMMDWEFNTEAKYNKCLGYKAFQDGLGISDSPFIYNSSDDVAHYWWIDGWYAAQDDE